MDNSNDSDLSWAWATEYPEIFKICTLFNLREIVNPKRFKYRSLPILIQKGPQCGLVALAMCSIHPNEEFVQFLYNEAVKRNYTNSGEMFSAEQLAELAECFVKNYLINLYSGCIDNDDVKELLLNGSIMLVPYDCDKNHSPGFENGKKAHWAVICGAVETEDDFFVIARHGKARNVAVWRLKDLALSNGQLNEVGSYLKNPDVEFKVPEGGINGHLGLNLKSIFLHPNS